MQQMLLRLYSPESQSGVKGKPVQKSHSKNPLMYSLSILTLGLSRGTDWVFICKAEKYYEKYLGKAAFY